MQQLINHEILDLLPQAALPSLIAIFEKSAKPMLTEIKAHAQNNDLAALAEAAHKLKGSCVSMGAVQMAEVCKKLQEKGQQGDSSDIDEMLTSLDVLLDSTLKELKDFMAAAMPA